MSDLSGNDLSGSASFVFDEVESDLIYRSLLRPMRQTDRDNGGLFLKRYLTRPQYHFDLTAEKIQNLDTTDLPSTIAEGLLQYLKDHVGLTKEIDYLTDGLAATDLRKLIQLAIPLWRGKGTQNGLMSVVRLLTGRTPMYIDWFGYRFLIGEAGIGEEGIGTDSWLIGGDASEWDEFTSHLRIMDDGTLDEDLLLDLIGIIRPLSETIEIALVNFIDRFDINLDRWGAITSKELIQRDVDDKVGVFVSNAAAKAIVPTGTLEDSVMQFKFKLQDSADKFQVYFHSQEDGSSYLSLRYEPASGWIFSHREDGDPGPTDIATIPTGSIPIVPDAWYTLRIEVTELSSSQVVKLYVDSSYMGGTTLGDVPSGDFFISVPNTNVEDFLIDNAEIYSLPLRFATVDKDGPTYTDNFID